MRIEILVGNSEEPLIYPINKPKLTIGSAETCDIIVDAPNISRKHIQLISEGDSYFVVDQGSTNGSFINEERLVPGRRTEFTSFFPVRLGEQVLITLLSDEEEVVGTESTLNFPEIELQKNVSPGKGSDESTKMVSLRDLQKAKTADLVERRQTIIKKKTAEKAPDKKASSKPKSKRVQEKNHMAKIKIFVALLVGAAAYVNFYVIEKPKQEVAKMGEVIPLDPKQKVQLPEKEPEPVFVLPESELPKREKVQAILADIKCTLDTEKYFCDKIYRANETPFGVVQVGTVFYILVDGEVFYEDAKKVLPLPPAADPSGQHTPEELKKYEDNIHDLMAAIFLLRAVPADLDQEKMKDVKLAFGLFRKGADGNYNLETVVSVIPSSLKEFKRLFEEIHVSNVKQIGMSAIEFVKKYYRAF